MPRLEIFTEEEIAKACKKLGIEHLPLMQELKKNVKVYGKKTMYIRTSERERKATVQYLRDEDVDAQDLPFVDSLIQKLLV